MLKESNLTVPDATIFFFLMEENCAFTLTQDTKIKIKNMISNLFSNQVVYQITIFAQNLLLKKFKQTDFNGKLCNGLLYSLQFFMVSPVASHSCTFETMIITSLNQFSSNYLLLPIAQLLTSDFNNFLLLQQFIQLI